MPKPTLPPSVLRAPRLLIAQMARATVTNTRTSVSRSCRLTSGGGGVGQSEDVQSERGRYQIEVPLVSLDGVALSRFGVEAGDLVDVTSDGTTTRYRVVWTPMVSEIDVAQLIGMEELV